MSFIFLDTSILISFIATLAPVMVFTVKFIKLTRINILIQQTLKEYNGNVELYNINSAAIHRLVIITLHFLNYTA